MERNSGPGSRVLPVLISLAISAAVTVLLLLLIALLMYKAGLSGTVMGILILAVYVLAPFLGALVLGKRMKEKRFLWGLLLGVLYFAVFVLISVVTKDGAEAGSAMDYLKVALAVLPGGILGGMFS